MTVYDYREITLKDDLCLEISRDTDIENPRENDCNAATFYCLKSPRRKIGDIIDSAYYLNETKRTLAKTGEYAILPIYIYEHSGIALCTVPFSDIWDSACIGFAVANINDFMKQRISDTPVSAVKPCTAPRTASVTNSKHTVTIWQEIAGNTASRTKTAMSLIPAVALSATTLKRTVY